MASANLGGVKQLLQAETQAQEKINKARKDKVALLKRARDEASAEIDDFRKQRQTEFDNFATSRTAGSQAHVRELQIHTDQEVSKVRRDIELHSNEVVEMLLKFVMNVNTTYTPRME